MRYSKTQRLSVELPSWTMLRWMSELTRLTWIPFSITVSGRWLASGLEILTSSLIACGIVQLGGKNENSLPIPNALFPATPECFVQVDQV